MFKLSFSSWSLSAHRASTKLAESFLSLRACASIQSVGRTRLGASWWLCRISLELFSVLMYWESDSSPLMYLYAWICKIDSLSLKIFLSSRPPIMCHWITLIPLKLHHSLTCVLL